MTLAYGSLFAGVGGFDLGFDRAGMRCAWQVEIDANCRKVLERHWPDVERFNDVKQCGKHNLRAVDLICGGFPCQDVSVAGGRTGLAGERSGLWYEFHRIIAELEPRWVVIENVPGLLSSNGGRDFAVIFRGLVECGYGVAWRVLDAQHFGVPQRRRRVFIVGHLGDGRAAEVLFERESGGGDTEARGEARPELAGDVAASLKHGGGNGPGYNLDAEGGLTVARISPPLCANIKRTGGTRSPGSQLQTAESLVVTTTFNGYTGGADDNDAQGGRLVMALNGDISPKFSQTMHTLRADQGGEGVGVMGRFGVRRLTPVECERLQGFPDHFTAGQSDGTRYGQMGNAVAVPVAEWIGQRIVEAV
jgi:DNA (cytosine-5)-methyltransferase 1